MPSTFGGYGLTSDNLTEDKIIQISKGECVAIETEKLRITLVTNKKKLVSEITVETVYVKKVILEVRSANGSDVKVGHYVNMSMQICSAYQRL